MIGDDHCKGSVVRHCSQIWGIQRQEMMEKQEKATRNRVGHTGATSA